MRGTGTVRLHPRGFGFVDLTAALEHPAGAVHSAFIPPPLTVTARPRRLLAGTVWRTADGWQLHPDPRLARAPITVPDVLVPSGARLGDAIVAIVSPDPACRAVTSVVRGPVPVTAPSWPQLLSVVTSLDAVAHPGDPDDGSWIVAAGAGQDTAPADVTGFVPGAQLRRRDLRSVTTVTIDGPTTKDLDDAVSVTRAGSALWVTVHIAAAATTAGRLEFRIHAGGERTGTVRSVPVHALRGTRPPRR